MPISKFYKKDLKENKHKSPYPREKGERERSSLSSKVNVESKSFRGSQRRKSIGVQPSEAKVIKRPEKRKSNTQFIKPGILSQSFQQRNIFNSKNRPIPKLDPIRQKTHNIFFENLGFASIPGYTEGIQKLNQDCIFVEDGIHTSPNLSLLAVYDGHGMFGNKVSKHLSLHTKRKIFY